MKKTGQIYFIEAVGLDMIKIGYTARWVSQRLRELQTTSPHELRLLHAFDGGPGDERAAHVRFAKHHHRGEWFKLSDEIRAFLVPRCDSPGGRT